MQILKIAQCPCKMTDALIHSGELRQARLQVETFPEWPVEVFKSTSQITPHALSLCWHFKVQLTVCSGISITVRSPNKYLEQHSE